ncbi:SDR family oxidoreductase [Paenibacillus pabuli]|uniref:SDR family oxidoreductase n=1 Tax=Paenibacillus pabuli TaxID=1472 RepID=UPI003CF357AA
MRKRLLDWSNEEEIQGTEEISKTVISKKDIAIIGIDASIAGASDLTEFWRMIRNGESLIREIPENRKSDVDAYMDTLRRAGVVNSGWDYSANGFLQDVAGFDPGFFSISPREASLMDPHQRLFLLSAWRTVEDAGYIGKIAGTNTGLFVGHSSDFGESYKNFIRVLDPEHEGLSVPGNIKSIIASRLSYLLDLKGPSLLVDTACSSSLVAVHMACQAMKNGECDMALVGGIKLNLLPVKVEHDSEIGIGSSDQITKTFENSADGTGFGEGVISMMLKPLWKAVNDGDRIDAVIKGSAVNQDGSSTGITAPNPSAQEELLLRAWQDAGIEPETITYIEAHGTGTKLGDPIEISGIQRAFSNFTKKRQFCAVRSVKSNIGHLDHAAGIAGLAAAVLALKHKELPPTVHFNRPNRNISFEDSAVYVNDAVQGWNPGENKRRCGVSSFGLSGTNCHVILEEAPEREREVVSRVPSSEFVFLLSAKKEESLRTAIGQYVTLLSGDHCKYELADLCYTAAAARGSYYPYRLAVRTDSKEDLLKKLNATFSKKGLVSKREYSIYYGESSSENEAQTNLVSGAILLAEAGDSLDDLCKAYIAGESIDWTRWYEDKNVSKVSLPGYPFLMERHWVDVQNDGGTQYARPEISSSLIHPLVEKCSIRSMNTTIYTTIFNGDKYWILNEHLIDDFYVLPGTGYVEMAYAIGELEFKSKDFELTDIIFMSPMMVVDGESREVQVIVQYEEEEPLHVLIASESGEKWITHATMTLTPADRKSTFVHNLSDIQARCQQHTTNTPFYDGKDMIRTGPRWDCLTSLLVGEGEALAFIEMPEAYRDDVKDYVLHPAMLDVAVNLGIRSIGEGLYLPFTYHKCIVHGRLPHRFYSYVRKSGSNENNQEIATFDIILMDEHGQTLVEVDQYSIKKVRALTEVSEGFSSGYEVKWVNEEIHDFVSEPPADAILVFRDREVEAQKVIDSLLKSGRRVIEVDKGSEFKQWTKHKYEIQGTAQDCCRLLDEIRESNIVQILHFWNMDNDHHPNSIEQLESILDDGLHHLFNLTHGLDRFKPISGVELILVAKYAHHVLPGDEIIVPHNTALFTMGQVIRNEMLDMTCKCIDLDDTTPVTVILDEMSNSRTNYEAAWRNGKRYAKFFDKIPVVHESKQQAFDLRDQGVYIITGGIGAIGMEIAAYLSSLRSVRIALLTRSEFPVREQWQTIVRNDLDHPFHDIIKHIVEIELSGSLIEVCACDVSNQNEMGTAIANLRNKYGSIHGVVHCAGIPGEGIIALKTLDSFKNTLSPKIFGTWLLHQLTINDPLDFFILCSSVSTVLYNPGESDYAAANSYLDGFADYRNSMGLPVLTINWAAWKEKGMATRFGLNESGVFKALSTNEAMSAFQMLIGSKIHRAIVGKLNREHESFRMEQLPFNLSKEIVEELKPQGNEFSSKLDKTTYSLQLQGRDDGNYTDTEKQVAAIWGDILGLKEVNIHQDLYAAGGDSIFALKISNQVSQTMQTKVRISDLFENMTVYSLAEFLDQLEKEQNKSGGKTKMDISEEVEFELSNAQKRIWAMQKLNPETTAFHLISHVTLEPSVSIKGLYDALNYLVQRHASLRTYFVEKDSVPKQKIRSELRLDQDIVNLYEESGCSLEEALEHENKLSFRLDGVLFRIKIFQCPDQKVVLYTNVHHIVTDGWSMDLFFTELKEAYRFIMEEKEISLQPLSMHYVNWVERQQEFAKSDEFNLMEQYWLRELAKPLPVLNLLSDYKRPKFQTYNGNFVKFVLSEETTHQIKVWSQREGATLQVLLLALYFVMLQQLTLDEEIIIGVPVTNRDHSELEGIVGLFINNICIRIDFRKIRTFRELLEQVKQKSIQAYKYSQYPFEMLVSKLNPDRDTSRSPIFATMFQFSEHIPPETKGVCLYDLNVFSKELDNKSIFRFEYNTDLFDVRTIERLCNWYEDMIDHLLTDSECLITDLGRLHKISKEEDEFNEMNFDFNF